MSNVALIGLVPGVYVREVDTGSRPIAGVGTSTAGFIGFLKNAKALADVPPGELPKQVTSFESFSAAFLSKPDGNGAAVPDAETLGDEASQILIEAVRGFFANGGSTCYILPVKALNVATVANVAVDEVALALTRFEAIDDVSILAVPVPSLVGETAESDADGKKALERRADIRAKLVGHCVKMNDRFAVLDAEEDGLDPTTKEPVLSLVYPSVGEDGSVTGRGPSSDPGQAAIYYPWLIVGGRAKPVPPSGHVAGLYARVDAERGVFKAPANEFLRGASRPTALVSPAQQGLLNPDGVNVIRVVDGALKVYGARTIKTVKDKGLEYVSTRRYLNFLRESIEKGTEFVLFEPNTPALWQRVIRTVGDFLYTQWTDGGLFGATPREAFFARCDAALNPESERRLGRLNIDFGVAIVQPAEFVIFRLAQQVPPA